MKRPRSSFLGGLSVQLLALTVLPLTVLLLVIAFGSISLHQQDMRALVGERDERAVRSAAAALTAELHHRAASISNLVALVEESGDTASVAANTDLAADFEGGLAYLGERGEIAASSSAATALWDSSGDFYRKLASAANPGPLFSEPIRDPESGKDFIIVSEYSPTQKITVAGAISVEPFAHSVLSASYPENDHINIYLVDSSGHVLFARGRSETENLPANHPGVSEALQGRTGTTYVQVDENEHVVAYSPIAVTGWALITEEEWEMVVSPSLQATQMAPLVLVPAFILAVLALGFVARRIVQPLQQLETKAAALAWGDFEAIQEPVGGILEVQHLQTELHEMSRKVRAAQEGLHDYIGAITSAQEEERLRLARELHDETIQSVIALKQRVQLARKSVKDQASKRTLEELESLSEQTIDGLRRMTRALRPIYLEDLGLVTALEMLARETSQNHNLDIEFKVKGGEQRLSHEVELALYRIAQEALSNVVRHARATHASLQLEFGERGTLLEVRDDGAGFEMPKSPTDFAPNGHFGLLGIRERAELIGARLEVDSQPGAGTRLRIML